ncbi:MAG: hypothetical protein IJ120_01215 [Solobacterium sp.]|nr:hypothetical protein [Solobacterium sp.]
MRTIQAKPLSKEAFRRYGEYQNLLDTEDLAKASINPRGFFADVLTLNFGTTTLPTVSVCHVTKTDRKIVRMMEAHQYTCEGLLPIDADVIIFVGTPGRGKFTVDNLEAFIIPQGTFVKLNPLIVHGTQYVIDKDEAHILCMLPGRTFRNDMIAVFAEDEAEQAEIVL